MLRPITASLSHAAALSQRARVLHAHIACRREALFSFHIARRHAEEAHITAAAGRSAVAAVEGVGGSHRWPATATATRAAASWRGSGAVAAVECPLNSPPLPLLPSIRRKQRRQALVDAHCAVHGALADGFAALLIGRLTTRRW